MKIGVVMCMLSYRRRGGERGLLRERGIRKTGAGVILFCVGWFDEGVVEIGEGGTVLV